MSNEVEVVATEIGFETRKRLDLELVKRGYFSSRAKAQESIRNGCVSVDGRTVTKAGWFVHDTSVILLQQEIPDFVGRGGRKLAAALHCFSLKPADKIALDVGASTGGFTQALLDGGARRVYALDVGRNQLHPSLSSDPRVVILEQMNARSLPDSRVPEPVDLCVIDVSFISLRLILPVVMSMVRDDGDVIALIKPQFETGRPGATKKGVIRDPSTLIHIVSDLVKFCSTLAFKPLALCPSPITGRRGNKEIFIRLKQGSESELGKFQPAIERWASE